MEINEDELRTLLNERNHLREQVVELQNRMTKLIEEQRAASLKVQVTTFHYAVGQPVHTVPRVPDAARVRLRLRLITEEVFEAVEAAFGADDTNLRQSKSWMTALLDDRMGKMPNVDLPLFIDALADTDYVVEGTRIEFGVDGAPVAAEVQRSNMAKVIGGTVRADGKILKPAGWTPPDIRRVLLEQGWIDK